MSGFDDDLDEMMKDNSLPSTKCAISTILSRVSEDQASRLISILDADIVPSVRVASMLRRNGFPITDKSVARHRRRKTGSGCTCP